MRSMHNGLQSSHFVQGKLDVQSTMVLRVSHFVPRKLDVQSSIQRIRKTSTFIFFSFISVHILLHLHVNFLTCELQFPFTFHLNFHVWKSRESIPETNLVSLRKRRRRTPYPLIYFTPKGFTAELETATDTLFVCVPLCFWRTCSFDSFTVHFTIFILW